MSSSYISENENQNGQFNGEEYETGSFTPIKSEMEEEQNDYEADTVAEEEDEAVHCGELKRKPSDASVASNASDSSTILGPPKKARQSMLYHNLTDTSSIITTT